MKTYEVKFTEQNRIFCRTEWFYRYWWQGMSLIVDRAIERAAEIGKKDKVEVAVEHIKRID